MWAFLDRVGARWGRRVAAVRRRSTAVDHLFRAWARYDELYAGRLAAATAYYSFFAVLAMALVTFAILGQMFRNNRTVVDIVKGYLHNNLPQLQVENVIDSSGKIGIVALAGLVVAGVGWVENLRSSQRALWRLDQQPGNPVVRWLVDLAVLIGLGLLLMASVAISSGLQDLLLRLSGREGQSLLRTLTGWSDVVLAGGVDLLLGAALLAGVPRLRMSLRRLFPSALLFAVGLGLLKTAGEWYILRAEHNPAYQIAAGTVGLLLFMYLLHRVLLFAAALAATSVHGRVVDLAGASPPRDLVAIAASAERAAASMEAAAASMEAAAKAAKGTGRP